MTAPAPDARGGDLIGAALAVAGVVVSALILRLHVDHAAGCVIGVSQCTDVVRSSYGSPFGVPLPVFSLPYYAALAAVFAIAFTRGLDPDARLELGAVLRPLVTAVFVGSLALLYVAVEELRAWCVFCVSLDVINLALLLVVHRRFPAEAPPWRSRWIVLGVAAIAFIGSLAAVTTRATPPQAPRVRGGGLAIPSGELPTVDVAVNVECEHCATAWPILLDALRRLARDGQPVDLRVHLVVPDRACAEAAHLPEAIDLPYDPRACEAAAHLVCAQLQGKAAAFLDAQLAARRRRGAGAPASLTALAIAAGIDGATQRACTGDDGSPWRIERMPDPSRRALFAQMADARPYLVKRVTPQLYAGGAPVTLGDRDPAVLARKIRAHLP